MESEIATLQRNTPSLQVGQPLNFRLPITIALDNASTLIDTADTFTDFTVTHSLLTQALNLCDAVCAEITNPLSPLRPINADIDAARRIKLFCHAKLITLLSDEDFTTYRPVIHGHFRDVLRISGRRLITYCKPELGHMFDSVRLVIENSGWSLRQQVTEYYDMVKCAPEEEHYWGIRFWFELSISRMQIRYLERCVSTHRIEDVKEGVVALEKLVDQFKETLHTEPPKDCIIPVPHWEAEDYYTTGGQKLTSEYTKLCKDVEVRWLLSQGNKLLEVITERTRQIEPDYFRFQAMLALDSYRAAYQICETLDDVNVELEGLCLWSMARVTGSYLSLHTQAHELYLAAVMLVGMNCAVSPDEEWYKDSIQQIQSHRKRLEDEETKCKESRRAGVMGHLYFEMVELQNRADRVKDEISLRAFFQWLLRTHPPRFSRAEVGVSGLLECRELSKVVLNVIGAYDRSRNEGIGVSWEVMCEEIIKVLKHILSSGLMTDY